MRATRARDATLRLTASTAAWTDPLRTVASDVQGHLYGLEEESAGTSSSRVEMPASVHSSHAHKGLDGITGAAPSSVAQLHLWFQYLHPEPVLRVLVGSLAPQLPGATSATDAAAALSAVCVLGCTVLLAMHAGQVPETLRLIVTSAFTGQAAVGGFAGAGIMMAMRWGVARGLFSNESGLGSAPIVAAAAQTSHPVRQALVSSTGTFWDTVVVCAMTGLVVVNSGEWHNGLNGASLTKAAFSDVPVIGPIILTGGLLTFVFSTILGWCYYGEKAIEYLLGVRAIVPYRILWVVAVFVGSVTSLKAVWSFADIANGLMAIPNLISLIVLSPVIVALTREHLWDGEKVEKPS